MGQLRVNNENNLDSTMETIRSNKENNEDLTMETI